MARKRITCRRGRKKRKVSKFQKAFLITIFCIAQIIFLSSPLFKLQSVEVIGSQSLTPQQIIQLAQIPIGKSVFLLKIKSLKSKIKNLAHIKDVHFSFKAPGRLTILVLERQPKAMIKSAKSPKKWYYVSHDGSILKETSQPAKEIVKIILEDETISGQTINPKFIKIAQKASKILPQELRNNLECYYINSKGEVTLGEKYLDGFIKIRIGHLENMEYKLNLLSYILRTIKEKNIKPVYIDLRFSEPVVKTKT